MKTFVIFGWTIPLRSQYTSFEIKRPTVVTFKKFKKFAPADKHFWTGTWHWHGNLLQFISSVQSVEPDTNVCSQIFYLFCENLFVRTGINYYWIELNSHKHEHTEKDWYIKLLITPKQRTSISRPQHLHSTIGGKSCWGEKMQWWYHAHPHWWRRHGTSSHCSGEGTSMLLYLLICLIFQLYSLLIHFCFRTCMLFWTCTGRWQPCPSSAPR